MRCSLWLVSLTWPFSSFVRVVACVIACACSVTQSWPALCNTIDCSLPSSSVHRILQVRILEWVAITSSRGSSWSRDWSHVSCVSCIGRQILYYWATWDAPWGWKPHKWDSCPSEKRPQRAPSPFLPRKGGHSEIESIYQLGIRTSLQIWCFLILDFQLPEL